MKKLQPFIRPAIMFICLAACTSVISITFILFRTNSITINSVFAKNFSELERLEAGYVAFDISRHSLSQEVFRSYNDLEYILSGNKIAVFNSAGEMIGRLNSYAEHVQCIPSAMDLYKNQLYVLCDENPKILVIDLDTDSTKTISMDLEKFSISFNPFAPPNGLWVLSDNRIFIRTYEDDLADVVFSEINHNGEFTKIHTEDENFPGLRGKSNFVVIDDYLMVGGIGTFGDEFQLATIHNSEETFEFLTMQELGIDLGKVNLYKYSPPQLYLGYQDMVYFKIEVEGLEGNKTFIYSYNKDLKKWENEERRETDSANLPEYGTQDNYYASYSDSNRSTSFYLSDSQNEINLHTSDQARPLSYIELSDAEKYLFTEESVFLLDQSSFNLDLHFEMGVNLYEYGSPYNHSPSFYDETSNTVGVVFVKYCPDPCSHVAGVYQLNLTHLTDRITYIDGISSYTYWGDADSLHSNLGASFDGEYLYLFPSMPHTSDKEYRIPWETIKHAETLIPGAKG